jgi:transcription antitermination factor NusG
LSVYVAEVREGRSELKAVRDLREAGVVCFTPYATRLLRRCRGRRRVGVRLEPLVPGYAFVWSTRILADEGAVLAVNGIEQLLGGEHPLELRGDWLDRVLIAQCFGLFDYTRDRRPKLQVRQAVKIIGGAFQGLAATVKDLDCGKSHDKVRVTVKDRFFAGTITLSRDEIEAFDSSRESAATRAPATERPRGSVPGSTLDDATRRSANASSAKAKHWVKLGDLAVELEGPKAEVDAIAADLSEPGPA